MKSSGFLLWQVSNQWQRLQREGLARLDLTPVQFLLLSSVQSLESESVVTQAALASYAETDQMMTSQVVRTLQQKGLLIRSDHPEDSRALQLVTTAKGRKVIQEAMCIVEKIDKSYFKEKSSLKNHLIELLSENAS